MELMLFDETLDKIIDSFICFDNVCIPKHPTIRNIAIYPDGTVYKQIKGKIKKAKTFTSCYGYPVFNITVNGKSSTRFIHRVVAETYLLPEHDKSFVNHKNGIKKDSFLENLEWISPLDNTRHAINMGLMNNSGERNGSSKADDIKVICFRTIRPLHSLKTHIFKNFEITLKQKETFKNGWKNLPSVTKEEIINERSKHGNDFIKR